MLDPLYSKPWKASGPDFPRSLRYPKGMVGTAERRAYFWFGKHWLSGAGCVVDAGSFLGASTFCFAAGAASGGHREFNGQPIVHAYDYFEVVDAYVAKAVREHFLPLEANESYLDIFEFQTASYASLIRAHPGDFLAQSWHGDPIEILFIDIAKSPELSSHVVGEFFPSLIPGRSIVLHQDYFHCWHPYLHVAMEFFRDEFELIDEYVPHQTRIWRLAKPLPSDKIECIRAYSLDQPTRMWLLDRLVNASTAVSRPMMEVVRLWQRCLDKDYEGARADMARLRAEYGVDGRRELWFRQAIRIDAFLMRTPG